MQIRKPQAGLYRFVNARENFHQSRKTYISLGKLFSSKGFKRGILVRKNSGFITIIK